MNGDERELREALDRAGRASPVPPADDMLPTDLRRGRKALRRQRIGVAAGAMCGVAVVALVAAFPSASSPPVPTTTRTPDPTPAPTCPPYAGTNGLEAFFAPIVLEYLRRGEIQPAGGSIGADPRCSRFGYQIEYVDQYIVEPGEPSVVNTVGMGVLGPEGRSDVANGPDGEPCALSAQYVVSEPLLWESCRTDEVPEGTLRIAKASDGDQCSRGMTLFRDDGYVVSLAVSTSRENVSKRDLPISIGQMREIVRDPSLVEPPAGR